MSEFSYLQDCSFLLNSSDKYSSAWYPFFELVKKFWKERPENFYLNTETKSYACEGLNIITVNCDENISWSERLYRCLEKIPTKYIIFSLEDFFLLGTVKNDRIQKAYEHMEQNPNIAVCRMLASNNEKLIKSDEYEDFYIAGNDVLMRLDTQIALWNRETLMSFLDFSEDPWQFEGNGSERVKDTEKLFLYYYQEDICDVENMIFPYMIRQDLGYGIAWSRWLWKNKLWFEKNGIFNVDYKSLGVLSERSVKRRFKYLYNQTPKGIYRLIKKVYRFIDRVERGIQFLRIFGIKNGIKRMFIYINR